MKCENSTPICFGIEYRGKKKCDTCPASQECAERWSEITWNTRRLRHYSKRGVDGLDDEWDDLFKAYER
jgi:hypothetical protein